MKVTSAERARFEAQVRSLRAIDDPGELSITQMRAELGEIQDDDDNPPEAELHRRAIALGMVRRSR